MSKKIRLYLADYVDASGESSVGIEIRQKMSDGSWLRKRENTNVRVRQKDWVGKHGKWISRSDRFYHIKNEDLERILKAAESTNIDKTLDFFSFCEHYISLSESSERVTRRRILDYKNTIRILKDFERTNQYAVRFDSMDFQFISLFLSYMVRRGMKQNYRRKQLKIIKRFLRVSMNEGYHSNTSFTTDAWSIPEILPDEIYLNTDEIDIISKADVTGHLERDRDVFVAGCSLGLRYSDLSRLDSSKNIITHRGRQRIKIEQQKSSTKDPVVIPINSSVRNFLDKYNGFPKMVPITKFNQNIKKVCQIAGIKNFQKVSSHTMRRSFATNAYLNKVPTHSIMKITGHKSEASFLRYIRISKEENADFVGDHPFFS